MIFQRGAGRAPDRIEEIIAPKLNEPGRAIRLNHDGAIAVQILAEHRLIGL